MSQPMLSVKLAQGQTKAAAHLLPCRVQHNGTIDSVSPFWKPTEAEDGTKTAFFRGRKLQGRSVKLPEQYKGVLLERKQPALPDGRPSEYTGERVIDEETPLPSEAMKATTQFDEIVVWSTGAVESAATDPYIRSMEEWIQVADQIHSYPEMVDGPRKDT